MIRGFTRILIADFPAYNAAALARIKADNIAKNLHDPSLDNYTYYWPDADPLYCWIRQEQNFTSLMTDEERATVISRAEAVEQGMIVPMSVETEE